MNIAIILASGKGTRLKNKNIEKQFISIRNKPIFLHTLQKFLDNKNIDKIVLVINKNKIKLVENNIKNIDNISIISGGETRNESIKNAIIFLDQLETNDNDIVLIHDGVRMFVSEKIIDKNIKMCKKYNAVTTAVPCLDTIIKVNEKNHIKKVPCRDTLYNNQTPQTFKFSLLKMIYLNKKIPNTSDTCKLLLKQNINEPIYVIKGEYENFKITNDFDLKCAKNNIKN